MIVTKKKIDNILSANCIPACSFKNRMRDEFIESLNSNDAIQINNYLIKMHSGAMDL